MLAISFAEKYYTLWEKQTIITKTSIMVNAHFIKNLSMDFETAKSKLSGKIFEVDLSLTGRRISTYKTIESETPVTQFSFGQLKGEEILSCDNIWFLKRAYNQETKQETKDLAKKRLILLGYQEFIYPDGLKEMLLPDEILSIQKELKEKEKIESLTKDHFFIQGEKVTLEKITVYNFFSFPSNFGTQFVIEMFDSNNRYFKYLGSNPPDFLRVGKENISLKATIKHSEYNNNKETILTRIKEL